VEPDCGAFPGFEDCELHPAHEINAPMIVHRQNREQITIVSFHQKRKPRRTSAEDQQTANAIRGFENYGESSDGR
jgi:hypothetical protein